jgi:hypothetical protein
LEGKKLQSDCHRVVKGVVGPLTDRAVYRPRRILDGVWGL